MTTLPLPNAFIWRRLHSLTGVWLVLFLIEHLITNSQAALLIGDDGNGFVQAVNWIYELPYLQVIEVLLIAIPFIIHGVWGVQYALTSKQNIVPTDGSAPALGRYPRNRGFTWQRVTSWLLIIGILAHVVQMRFMDYPVHAQIGAEKQFMVRLRMDDGLYTLAARLGTTLYDHNMIEQLAKSEAPLTAAPELKEEAPFDLAKEKQLEKWQVIEQEHEWIAALQKKPIKSDEIIAVSNNIGKAFLLSVRDTFKSIMMALLYTLFVIAATYHAFNGLWTALITWGIILSPATQAVTRILTTGLMILVTFLGLAAIWGTYWINLKQ